MEWGLLWGGTEMGTGRMLLQQDWQSPVWSRIVFFWWQTWWFQELGWLLVQGTPLTQGSRAGAASLHCWADVLLVVDNKILSSSLKSRLVPVGQRPHFPLPRGENIDP